MLAKSVVVPFFACVSRYENGELLLLLALGSFGESVTLTHLDNMRRARLFFS